MGNIITNNPNPMIGKTVTITDRTGVHKRKILFEKIARGTRLYMVMDVQTNTPMSADAETYDRLFKTKPGKVLKRSKGQPIIGKQKRA